MNTYGTQCVNCGHVAAPARSLYQCPSCNSADLHIFEAELEEDYDWDDFAELEDTRDRYFSTHPEDRP